MSRTELPYIDSFINHHRAIGAQDFVFISTREGETEEIRELLSNYPETKIVHKGSKDLCGCQNLGLGHVKTKWVASLDIDEYIILPQKNWDEFVAVNRYSEKRRRNFVNYSLSWKIGVCDKREYLPTHDVFGVNIGKYVTLKRPELVLGEHNVRPKGIPMRGTRGHKAFIFHYWGRTINDVILKSVYHEFRNKAKRSNRDQLLGAIAGGALPPRLRVLAALEKHAKYRTLEQSPLKVDGRMERELIAGCLSPADYRDIISVYERYKTILDVRLANQYPNKGISSIRQLARILPETSQSV